AGAHHFMDVAWKRAFDSGQHVGPRLFASGYFLTTTGGHFLTSGHALEVDGPYGWVKAIREQIKNGVDHVKLNLSGGIMGPAWDLHTHSFLLDDEIRAAFEICRKRGFKVMAHATNPEAVKNAIRLGAHSVEHGMRVRASSLNYRDLMVLKGGGRGPTKIGVVPLSDGAGEVAAIGEGVTRVKIDDRIAGCFHPRWFGGPIKPDYLTDRLGANLDGVLAEYAVFNEEAVVLLPSHLSFEEAATLPCAAVTAWVALTGHRRVTAGDTVLIQGSGGVSVFALQFARVLGARVIATTSTAEKAERLKALGASDVINYTETSDWDAKVRELTGGRGVDCIVEIGGPRSEEHTSELQSRGHLVC